MHYLLWFGFGTFVAAAVKGDGQIIGAMWGVLLFVWFLFLRPRELAAKQRKIVKRKK